MAIRPDVVQSVVKEDVKNEKKPVKNEYTFTDDDLVTVLYGYGRVAAQSVSYLDDYVVKGGVIRNVPYSVAKHWKAGTRADGKRTQGRVQVQILPQDAPEAEFALAVGLSADDIRKLGVYMSAIDADSLLAQLSPEQLKQLHQALGRKLSA